MAPGPVLVVSAVLASWTLLGHLAPLHLLLPRYLPQSKHNLLMDSSSRDITLLAVPAVPAAEEEEAVLFKEPLMLAPARGAQLVSSILTLR